MNGSVSRTFRFIRTSWPLPFHDRFTSRYAGCRCSRSLSTTTTATRRRRRTDARTIVLHSALRPDDSPLEVVGDPLFFQPFAPERHGDRRITGMAVVREQRATVER